MIPIYRPGEPPALRGQPAADNRVAWNRSWLLLGEGLAGNTGMYRFRLRTAGGAIGALIEIAGRPVAIRVTQAPAAALTALMLRHGSMPCSASARLLSTSPCSNRLRASCSDGHDRLQSQDGLPVVSVQIEYLLISGVSMLPGGSI